MNRLISLEPSNLVAIRIEPGQKCYGQITLRNVMYTMPVAFRFQPLIKTRYSVKPQSGIIPPLEKITVEIVYHLTPGSTLPEYFPYSNDSFLLHSVVVPGATTRDYSTTYDAVPSDWFTTKKKQVFTDSGVKIMFVGSSVLARLVADGSMDEIRDVLEKSDPSWRAADSVDYEGQSLLHSAISQSRADLVQLILEFDPDVEAPSRSGCSPIEAAADSGEALIVELLLARKASTNRSENSTWGPIHLAARGGHIDVLRLLILKGANVDALTKDGNTALHLAVEEQRRDCVRLLLANGAMPDIRDTFDGDAPLHIAAVLGDEYLVKLLLQKGANKYVRNRAGRTAYDVAAENGHAKLFDALRLGDNLCTAARKGEVRTMVRLIEHGAAINGRDQHGWTALHRACFKGRVEAVRALLEKGVDVDAKDEDGYTALHCAAESGHADVIELVVKKGGADVEARTNKGVTALQIAESLGYSGITRLLIHGGATRDHKNNTKNNYNDDDISQKMIVSMEGDQELKKKKSRIRGRAVRGSFDRSKALVMV
ncbi:protein VAPYRIN-like [Humulus lupulus]|uniref:protein VAPYRIN-like n=1 Tax=Humulus lupulus TaxID=3486 RepID=UPI002B40ED26|nr:protein VAPYRIN-like [Humulus lupulus]